MQAAFILVFARVIAKDRHTDFVEVHDDIRAPY